MNTLLSVVLTGVLLYVAAAALLAILEDVLDALFRREDPENKVHRCICDNVHYAGGQHDCWYLSNKP